MEHYKKMSIFDIESPPATSPKPPALRPVDLITENVFTVSEAVALLNGILEPLVLTIEGEVSGYHLNQGKFVFFDIKDESGLLACFMMVHQMSFPLTDGMKIRLRAVPKVRAQSGKLGLTVKSFELLGEGLLLKAFEELRQRLTEEGIFDARWKKALPLFPRTIGLVTSKSGDALQDMLRIMRNRAGGLQIYLAPSAVQGQSAVVDVCRAIQYFNTRLPVDVMIVARGGGSIEDLQAFNAEPVVRAIFASKIPVVTGIGHEPDVTLVDYVSDVRAATPTNAAEIVAPDFNQLLEQLTQMEKHLVTGTNSLTQRNKSAIDALLHRLMRSLAKPQRQTLALQNRLIFQLKVRERALWQKKSLLANLAHTLMRAEETALSESKQRLALVEMQLTGLDPEAVLARGYSIVTTEDGTIVRSVKQVLDGQELGVQLADGTIQVTVV